MTPISIINFPPSGGSPLQCGNTNSFKDSYSTNESFMETFHGLPEPQFEQPLERRLAADYTRTEVNNLGYSALYQQPSHAEWYSMHPMAYQYQKLENSYQVSPNNDGKFQSDVFIRESDENFTCEYTRPQSYQSGVLMPASMEPRYALGGFAQSLQQKCASDFTDLDGIENVFLDSPADFEQSSLSHSPTLGKPKAINTFSDFQGTPALVDISSSKASDDGEADSKDGNLPPAEGRISDAPYAKLIYKALMEAPNHSMVLQDIYQWFIDNTKKGSSASTGWRNSIRHNLSMNAAFRKTSRKSNGDDSKRASEWVLEPFAITEGVTPTTRYRKNGKKPYKSRNLGQTRVKSGRPREISSRKDKYQNQQSPNLHQGRANDQHKYTPMQQYTPPVMGVHNHSPYTPDCQQFFHGNPCNSSLSFLDDWKHVADFKSVQMNDEHYMDEHEHYEDRYPCVWTNSQYY